MMSMQLNCRHNFISSFVESEAVCMCLQRTFFFPFFLMQKII